MELSIPTSSEFVTKDIFAFACDQLTLSRPSVDKDKD